MITLKTLPYATDQMVYNQVVEHLRTQNAKSLNPYGRCSYRGLGGAKCAAGCLIASDEWLYEFEDRQWGYLANKYLVPQKHAKLIHMLQSLHDDMDTEQWEDSFKVVANYFHLEYKEPQQ